MPAGARAQRPGPQVSSAGGEGTGCTTACSAWRGSGDAARNVSPPAVSAPSAGQRALESRAGLTPHRKRGSARLGAGHAPRGRDGPVRGTLLGPARGAGAATAVPRPSPQLPGGFKQPGGPVFLTLQDEQSRHDVAFPVATRTCRENQPRPGWAATRPAPQLSSSRSLSPLPATRLGWACGPVTARDARGSPLGAPEKDLRLGVSRVVEGSLIPAPSLPLWGVAEGGRPPRGPGRPAAPQSRGAEDAGWGSARLGGRGHRGAANLM